MPASRCSSRESATSSTDRAGLPGSGRAARARVRTWVSACPDRGRRFARFATWFRTCARAQRERDLPSSRVRFPRASAAGACQCRGMTLTMTFDERYRAIDSRDARFDGQFVTAVRSTGIYCRPSCPARTPKPSNVTFYPTSAAAHEAGFRACRRCLPEAAPGSPQWNLRGDIAGRAMRLIADGVIEREGVPGLARRLGYSQRHLTRLLTTELGAGPLALEPCAPRADGAHAARRHRHARVRRRVLLRLRERAAVQRHGPRSVRDASPRAARASKPASGAGCGGRRARHDRSRAAAPRSARLGRALRMDGGPRRPPGRDGGTVLVRPRLSARRRPGLVRAARRRRFPSAAARPADSAVRPDVARGARPPAVRPRRRPARRRRRSCGRARARTTDRCDPRHPRARRSRPARDAHPRDDRPADHGRRRPHGAHDADRRARRADRGLRRRDAALPDDAGDRRARARGAARPRRPHPCRDRCRGSPRGRDAAALDRRRRCRAAGSDSSRCRA